MRACAQVSYSATSRELSDRARFSTFFRVAPSDLHQARLMVALLRAHNWTYVHALHTDGRTSYLTTPTLTTHINRLFVIRIKHHF